jgi:hypothetical protein
MKRLLVLLAAFVTSVACLADGATTKLIQPTGSELKLVELKTKDDLFAKFSGKVWVTGTFYGRWPAGAAALAHETPEYVVLPDRASKAALPHFVIKSPPYENSYKVRSIEIENEEDALRLAVGNAAAQRLLDRKTDSVRATGRFQIESLVVGVECDAPWAKAKVVRVDLPEKVAAHQKLSEGC